MENKICCCFGHRNVYQNMHTELINAIENLILHRGITIFMTGGMGDFDGQFAHAVRTLKHRYPNISLVLVKPYLTNELNICKEYYETSYDEILLPDVLANVHYKAAIKKRNRWMAEKSDVVITYVNRTFGGAYDASEYAKKIGKEGILQPKDSCKKSATKNKPIRRRGGS